MIAMGILSWEMMTKMAFQLVVKRNMNRVYIVGDVGPIRELLSDFRAAHDERGYWVPLHLERRLRGDLTREAEYQAQRAAERAAWDQAISIIPEDYKTRHGALYGGVVAFNGQAVADEPSLDTSKLPWMRIAGYVQRVRDLTGQSSINGRVMNSATLYRAVVQDGRTIYRVSHNSNFGDDLRETYYLPADLWSQMLTAEVAMRGITPEAARQWLAEFRGCVGTELYAFAAGENLISEENIRSIT